MGTKIDFEAYIQKDNPLAVLIGVPIYSYTAGILPIMLLLVQKEIPLGTAIAFSIAVVGLSISEGLLLKKVMTTKLLAIFFSVVTLCIILTGYLFNLVM